MKKNLIQEGQRKGHKRLTRERRNNKMLKRTEKRKKYPSEITWPEAVTSGFFAKQVVFLMVNHRGPLPLRELHSTGETIVWRDPGGSWACLPPLYHCECHHLATDCDTRGEEPYQMLKWTKPHKKLGRRRPKKKTWKEAFRMKGALWNSEQNKTTNNISWLEEKKKSTQKKNKPS